MGQHRQQAAAEPPVDLRPSRLGQPRREASLVGAAAVCALSALGAACGSDAPSGATRHSGDEWVQGVEVEVEDAAGAVDSATALFPDDRGYLSRVSASEFGADALSNPVAVLQRRDGELDPQDQFDVVVLYRDGPFCGQVPIVSVEGDSRELAVTITSVIEGPDCAAIQYAAAVGLVLTDEYQHATIRATHTPATDPAAAEALATTLG